MVNSKVTPTELTSGAGVKPIVVVGMSGGVDSSLTAALLLEQGYAVIGVYMKNWSEPIKGVEHCPWVQDQLDARQVAHQLGIPFYTVNFESEYKTQVIDSFLADYAAGRTPNPDILCNKFIKFDAFFKYAQSLGADYIATGHYAQVKEGKLYRGVDPKKDQSYFLWAIQPAVLSQVLFPLGGMLKSQVRIEAEKRGLVTAHKRDSQGICFIGQADVREFLASHLTFSSGSVLNQAGDVIGCHQGAGLYTIGQRAGISDLVWPDATNRPILYVLALDTRTNTVTVGPEEALYRQELEAEALSWLTKKPDLNQSIQAKIRYGQMPAPCAIVQEGNGGIILKFQEPQRAITPGQSIVFYDGTLVLGGGIIASASTSVLAPMSQLTTVS